MSKRDQRENYRIFVLGGVKKDYSNSSEISSILKMAKGNNGNPDCQRRSNCGPGGIEEQEVEEQLSSISEESSTGTEAKTEGDVSKRKAPKPDFGKKPIKMTCNYCHTKVKTKTISRYCKNFWHYCPNCGRVLGRCRATRKDELYLCSIMF